MSADGRALFAFVQLEFPWELGPPDGRYVLRGHAGLPAHVLMIATLGAQERRTLLRRRAKPRDAEPEPQPEPVTTTRATLVRAEPFAGPDDAEAWRAAVDPGAEIEMALGVLNRVIHAHRTAAADPAIREVARRQALVARVGIGEGEQVAHGHWTAAVTVPRPREPSLERRASMLRPQERLAALLGGRDVALACEELILRARLDLDAGRRREAALQLRVALEAAIAELAPWSDRAPIAERLGALRGERGVVGAAANQALESGLDDRTTADLGRVVGLVEAALRARTLIGLE